MNAILFTHLADYLQKTDLNIPTGSPDSVISTILRIVFAVAGGVSLIVITLSALRLVLSIGSPDAISRVRNTLIYAVAGLIVCMFGYTIVTFVLNRI